MVTNGEWYKSRVVEQMQSTSLYLSIVSHGRPMTKKQVTLRPTEPANMTASFSLYLDLESNNFY